MPFTDTPIGATPRRSETGHALPMYHGRARLSSPPGTKNPARSRPKPLQRVARQGEPQEGREKRDPCSGGRSPPNRATRSPEPPAGAAGRGGRRGEPSADRGPRKAAGGYDTHQRSGRQHASIKSAGRKAEQGGPEARQAARAGARRAGAATTRVWAEPIRGWAGPSVINASAPGARPRGLWGTTRARAAERSAGGPQPPERARASVSPMTAAPPILDTRY